MFAKPTKIPLTFREQINHPMDQTSHYNPPGMQRCPLCNVEMAGDQGIMIPVWLLGGGVVHAVVHVACGDAV